MILFPPCKINLGLNVKQKRDDDYHELESVMYQLPWCDILEIVKSDAFSFTSTGLTIPGNTETNLCIKAYQLLSNDYNLSPVKIHLHKILPMGAGLGGGSADGAYTLRILNEIFDLSLTNTELKHYASLLGSDCALFIEDKPQLAKGRGEILTSIELSLSGYYVQLINIGIHISTKMAFENLNFTNDNISFADLSVKNIHSWKDTLFNDFEDSIFPHYPELAQLKAILYENGAIYASMTGSGSTMFGIYKEKPKKIAYLSGNNYLEKILLINK
jgi:4-diphosphocytidyl-2-C-methyl-D-erythritol kinase